MYDIIRFSTCVNSLVDPGLLPSPVIPKYSRRELHRLVTSAGTGRKALCTSAGTGRKALVTSAGTGRKALFTSVILVEGLCLPALYW